MKIKKNIFLFFIFLLINTYTYCDDQELGKFYLIKAYEFFNENNLNISYKYLNKSYQYTDNFPEYYYLYNQIFLLDSTRFRMQRENSIMILKYLDNSFLFEKYDLLKHSCSVFNKVRDFSNAVKSYNMLFDFNNQVTVNDYIQYIEMLLNFKKKEYLKLIPGIINKAEEYFDSLDLIYLSILYNVLYGNINYSSFNDKIKVLISNNYSKIKILYLKSLYYNDSKSINEIINEFNEMKHNENDVNIKKLIIFNILKKSRFLKSNDLFFLLKEWNNIAQNDYRTILLLEDRYLYNYIRNNSEFTEFYLNYTGFRKFDDDNDGRWEKLYKYNTGNIIEIIVDSNQDNIAEKKVVYEKDEILDKLYLYDDTNNYIMLKFNIIDNSLKYINYIKENKTIKKDIFKKSTVFLDINKIDNSYIDSIFPYVISQEIYDDGFSVIKYNDTQKIFKNIDKNYNNIFEEKIFYKSNKINEVYKDGNEDGNYEILESYYNGKLKFIKVKTDELLNDYDFIEYVYDNFTIKYWDNDFDGKFEIKIENYSNRMNYFFDINFDNKYDYEYVYLNNKLTEIYMYEKGKRILYKKIKSNEIEISEEKKWKIISNDDISNLLSPDNIIIQDFNNKSGIYYFRNNKYFFKNGVIVNEFFSYRLFFINDVFYLMSID